MEEAGERRGVLRLRLLVGAHRLIAEEHREQGARGLDDVRDPGGGERIGHQLLQGPGGAGERVVGGLVQTVQRRETRRRRERVPGQGPRLVDGPGRGEQPHQVLATAEGADGKAAADHLPEGHQVRGPAAVRAVDPVVALARRAEAGEHLIADQQRAGGVRGLGQEAVEADPVLLERRHHAHVRGRGLGDDRGDLLTPLGEQGPHRLAIAVGQHHGVPGGRGGHAGRTGHREGRDTAAGLGEQRIHVPVVAAGELHDHVPAGRGPGHAQRAHGRLGAGVDQPHLLDRSDPVHDLLGEAHLARLRRAEGQPAARGLTHRLDHLLVRVPQDHRAP